MRLRATAGEPLLGEVRAATSHRRVCDESQITFGFPRWLNFRGIGAGKPFMQLLDIGYHGFHASEWRAQLMTKLDSHL